MDNQIFESTAERTFQYQDSLPPLPVPSLQGTLSKYLDAVRPFGSNKEFEATTAIVKRFEEGIGKHLHQKLLQRAKSRRNWLEDWWLDTAYLELRIPSQLNVNFGGPTAYLEHCWPAQEGTQLERASLILWFSLQYWDLIRREKLAIHKAGTMPFDMDQFRMLFCTCKVPGITKDTILNFFKTESEGPCPSHLVVMCRGRVFTFDGLCDGRILTPPELLRQLTYIKDCCEGEPEGDGLGALTTEERTRWAKAREYLISIDPANKTILETIQSALFVLSLDDAKSYSTPENYSKLTQLALTGDPTIRWGDKSYNLLSFSDGTFGSNCDHAPYDAMVLVSHGYYVDQKLRASGGVWKGSQVVRDLSVPEELIFTVDERVRRDISLAKEQYQKSSQDLQVVSYAFTSFGKEAIKKRKLHPDTFIQLALQLAYYRLHGKPGSCYETATTRRFFHGRTETMRSCTAEVQHWCRTMINPAATAEEKRQALHAAFNKHNKLMGEAQNGKGFDRHLLGLYLIAKEEGLPVDELYTDPLYAKSGGGGNFVLSTSLVGYTTVLGGVAPMVQHGYGFFYRIRDDRIVASCTAWKSSPETDAEALFQNLTMSFHDIMHLTTLSNL
ncbi:peroxisomal carnitine O-octanoyltransferase [Triplophysa dalaica]|uniref:peroxisomal carnitine O-octanoyltransferase n=1 Tax=Triplophysa dalaica TaxID=1582913 RepID=UPI0024DFEC73|nr:peroxisomal carnitine O-octanoyltransferase [Triplophysa dalaica]XP_056617664.1 peroxisomal carnitine O-octanoyltransferase [Triplophysa dalaica]